MLSLKELKSHAFKRGLKSLEHIRRDYAQDVVLFILYSRVSPKFIFKRGTCLWKLYKSPRFSEDIDLQIDTKIDFEKKLVRELELWGFDVETSKKRYTANTLFMILSLSAKGFGSTRIPIEVSFRPGRGENAILYSPYPDIPDFEVISQKLSDMIRDKIQAIMHRRKPRDLFDLYFIMRRYNVRIKCNKDEVEERIEQLRKLWNSLEPLVMRKLPDFNEVKEVVLNKCK